MAHPKQDLNAEHLKIKEEFIKLGKELSNGYTYGGSFTNNCSGQNHEICKKVSNNFCKFLSLLIQYSKLLNEILPSIFYYDPPTMFVNALRILSNPICYSVGETGVNSDKFARLLLEYYRFNITPKIIRFYISDVNKTHLELFFNYYTSLLKIDNLERFNTILGFIFQIEENIDTDSYNNVNDNNKYALELYEKFVVEYISKFRNNLKDIFDLIRIRHKYLINILINSKIVIPYNFLIESFIDDDIELSKKICMSGTKLKTNTFNDVLKKFQESNSHEVSSLSRILNCLEFLIDNDSAKFDKKNLIDLIQHINFKESYVHKSNLDNISEKLSLIFNKK
jgi:hypothetical protein